METISIMDGLMLTVVSMLVVFLVLGSIWGLVEFVSKIINQLEPALDTTDRTSTSNPAAVSTTKTGDSLATNQKHQKVAEIMALVIASEDEPNKKFEITESKRVK